VVSREDQSPALSRDHGAHPLADVPRFFAAIRRVEAMDAPSFDIHEIKCPLPPNWALSPLAANRSDWLDADHRTSLKASRVLTKLNRRSRAFL
jgi:hypothetical protein